MTQPEEEYEEKYEGDTAFLNERVVFFKRWTWVKIIAVAFALFSIIGWRSIGNQQDNLTANQAADVQRQINTDFRQCQEFNKMLGVVADLVDLSSTAGFDPTTIPEFQNLSPEDQAFWMAISQPSSNPDDPNSFRNRAKKLLVERDCEALYPGHR